jgi:hypothetical protein
MRLKSRMSKKGIKPCVRTVVNEIHGSLATNEKITLLSWTPTQSLSSITSVAEHGSAAVVRFVAFATLVCFPVS